MIVWSSIVLHRAVTRRFRVAVHITAFFIPCALAAQATGTVTGTVRSADTGLPVADVDIRVSGAARNTVTDDAGRFSVDDVPAGTWTVEARRPGWMAASVPVTVRPGTLASVDVVLPSSPMLLEQLVVTATRTERQYEDVPAAIAVRDVEQLRRNGFMFGTDEFRGVPGVSFRRGEGDGDEFPFVSIRGSSGTEGYLALIDGIPLVGIYEEALLNQVPYEALERVEVVKGPVSALYGRGALYGAVNYVTRSPRADATRVTGSAGTDGYYRGAATLERTFAGRSGRLLVDASYEDYGGWRVNGGRELLNLFGKLEVDLGARTSASVYANWADRHSELPNGLPLTENGEIIDVPGSPEAFIGFGDPVNDQQVGIGTLRLQHRPTDDLALTMTAQGRRIDGDVFWNFFDPFGFDASRNVYAVNGFRGNTRHDVLFGEATAQWSVGNHEIITGFAGERSTIRERNAWSGQFGFTEDCGFAFFLIEIDYTTGRITNRDHPCFALDVPYTRDHFVNTSWGAFLQYEIALTDALYLTAGLRYDAYRRTAEFEAVPASTTGGTLRGDADAFSPKASLSWRYDGGQVYASYGRGFNSNFGATFEWDPASYARPENRPTTIDSYELGWKGRALDGRIRFESALFFTRQRNRRINVPNPDAEEDPTAPSNLITHGQLYESRGVEVGLGLLPLEGTALVASYSHIDPEWDEYIITAFGGTTFDLSGRTPTGVSRNTLYLSVDQRVAPWLQGRASFELYDNYQITQDNSHEGGGYELLTLGARIQPRLRNDVTLDLTLTNALDREYFSYFGGRTAPTYATPGPPRQFRAAVRATF